MISIISPAKNMRNFKIDNIKPITYGKSRFFTKETEEILKTLKMLTPFDIQSIMKVNEKIGFQSYAYFQDFNFEEEEVCGLLAYDGLVFKNIKAEEFTEDDFEFANKHIRILDAFYGIVNPLDGILPYRLEMQYKININDTLCLKTMLKISKIKEELLKTPLFIYLNILYINCFRIGFNHT